MHDLVIRNATVIDGSGVPRQHADVAINDGIFTEIGTVSEQGQREIDANGDLLTPGWVDIHTHFDGQATWDPYLSPSSWHGVTTAVFGNCSVGFAPVRPGQEKYLINLMEGVEDIPESVLAEGLDFNWESFPDYLDVLESMPRIMDIGAQMPHAALRYYVMGERGADHLSIPSDEEIDEMGRLLEASLQAGALGFTTSRTTKHRAADGRPTPSLSAEEAELSGLAEAMKRAGLGVFQVNSDLGDNDFERLRQAAEIAGRPLSLLLLQVDNDPNLWRKTLVDIESANRDGIETTGQVGCRPISMLMGLEGSVHPFLSHPVWRELGDLSPKERLARILEDTELQDKLVTELPDNNHTRWMRKALERTFELGDDANYEPDKKLSVANLARQQGKDPIGLALELMMKDDGWALLLHPFENYFDGNLDVVREMLTHDHTVCGIADAGAHVGLICDSSAPTYLLTHWARDRARGEGIELEQLVKRQTFDTARTYDLNDRGLIAVGFKADFNIIDFEALQILRPKLVYDLPAGGKRIVQEAKGYRHTFVSGIEVMQDGNITGALPGKLIRGPQSVAA